MKVPETSTGIVAPPYEKNHKYQFFLMQGVQHNHWSNRIVVHHLPEVPDSVGKWRLRQDECISFFERLENVVMEMNCKQALENAAFHKVKDRMRFNLRSKVKYISESIILSLKTK